MSIIYTSRAVGKVVRSSVVKVVEVVMWCFSHLGIPKLLNAFAPIDDSQYGSHDLSSGSCDGPQNYPITARQTELGGGRTNPATAATSTVMM